MAWLTGWNYRKPIIISYGSALTDYQVLVTVDTAALVTADKLLSSCDDIRFTSSDGSTNLNYWIESGPNSSSTKIWVKIPSILASTSTTTIYLYYNNTGASVASNGTNTFIIFNAGDTLTGTTAITGTGYNTPSWSIVSNKIHGSPGSGNSLGFLYFNTTTGSSSYIIEADIQASLAGSYNNQFGLRFHSSQSAAISRLEVIWVEVSKVYTIYNSAGTTASSSSTTLSATLHKWKLVNNGSVKTLYIDGTQVVTQTETIDAENIGLYYYNASGESVTEDYSNIRVRKYAATEPTTCIGEEVSTITWLSDWNRRKLLTVTGSTAGAQTDYQMKLIVHKAATGTDTSTDIYLGTVNNDFSDLRFTSSNGSTLLNYWIESYTSGSVATVWIKIPSVPIGPCITTIYVYYNNTGASTTSNHDNVFIYSTGGTITYSGNYTIHAFLTGGTLTTNKSMNVEYLVVAGGGSGGFYQGGGGGAGGFLTGTIGVTAQAYAVTVGAGGAAITTNTSGSDGSNSVFSTVTAIGGGGGGGNGHSTLYLGHNGGSGGGGGGNGSGGSAQPAGGVGSQGNNGGHGDGAGSNYGAGGGGGGKGGTGSNGTAGTSIPATIGGNGGAGLQSAITGTNLYYAAGGGGAGYNGGTQGIGGSGIGGSAAGTGISGSGVANTGSGGAGTTDGSSSGAGGSGIVIIRYINRTITSPEPTFSTIDTEETLTCGTPSANLVVLEIVSNQLSRQYPSYIDVEAISKLLDSYM